MKSVNKLMPRKLTPLRLLPLFLALAITGLAQDKIEITTKTVTFQNGAGGYSGALEIGIQKKKNDKGGAQAGNIWISRDYDKAAIDGVADEQQALVQFAGIFGDKSSQIPPGASITKATLRLCVGSLKKAVGTYRVWLNRMLVPWDKNAAWDSPQWHGNGIKADGRAAVPESDALFVPNHNDTAYDIDVTESLRAWASGAANHGWVLRTTRKESPPAAFIGSLAKQARLRPMLTVSFDTNPANKAPEVKNLSTTPGSPGSVTLSLSADDDGKEPLNVTFHGRRHTKAGPNFEIVLLPDTQCYTIQRSGGKPEMFTSQVDWVVRNHRARNIAAVLHLGDVTDRGDFYEEEWKIAGARGLYRLEDPRTTGLPDGIPYAIAVGNHEQLYRDPEARKASSGKMSGDRNFIRGGPANLFNKYFNPARFKGRAYYGGSFIENKNHNHFILFDGGAEKFIVIALEYDFEARNPGVLKWAGELLKKHADRRGIVITHSTMRPGIQGGFTKPGELAYEALKACPNLMLIIGGHITGEGRRTDRHNGSVVHSIVKDFQSDEGGGNGWLGILTFMPGKNEILVRTYSPYLDKWRADQYAAYTLDYDFVPSPEPYAKLGETKTDSAGSATFQWSGLEAGATYEWFAKISDGQKVTNTKESIIGN